MSKFKNNNNCTPEYHMKLFFQLCTYIHMFSHVKRFDNTSKNHYTRAPDAVATDIGYESYASVTLLVEGILYGGQVSRGYPIYLWVT